MKPWYKLEHFETNLVDLSRSGVSAGPHRTAVIDWLDLGAIDPAACYRTVIR